MNLDMFRELTPEEVVEFKDWARQNYEPLTEIKGVWHPVIQAECALMNDEKHTGGQT
jgi:hypothetical protein